MLFIVGGVLALSWNGYGAYVMVSFNLIAAVLVVTAFFVFVGSKRRRQRRV
jgi:hypothetical protein